jgi:hypothetical protein
LSWQVLKLAVCKALKSFSGAVSMAAGEVRDIADPAIVVDLKRAKYVEEVKQTRRRTKKAEDEGNEG